MIIQIFVHLGKTKPTADEMALPDYEPYRYPLVFDDWSTYAYCFLEGCLGQLAISLIIITNQNSDPLLNQLLCYVNVVYSFAADKIVFHSDFNQVQIIGVVLILVLSLIVIGYKYAKEKKEKGEELKEKVAEVADDKEDGSNLRKKRQ
jgi:hypothetical protein